MSMLAPSEASRETVWILGTGAIVAIFTDWFWPLAMLWVIAAIVVLYHEHDEMPDPTERERIGDLT